MYEFSWALKDFQNLTIMMIDEWLNSVSVGNDPQRNGVLPRKVLRRQYRTVSHLEIASAQETSLFTSWRGINRSALRAGIWPHGPIRLGNLKDRDEGTMALSHTRESSISSSRKPTARAVVLNIMPGVAKRQHECEALHIQSTTNMHGAWFKRPLFSVVKHKAPSRRYWVRDCAVCWLYYPGNRQGCASVNWSIKEEQDTYRAIYKNAEGSYLLLFVQCGDGSNHSPEKWLIIDWYWLLDNYNLHT